MGRPNPSRAAANGSYWSGTISVSTSVIPSGSTTAPALGEPRPGGPSGIQTYTPASSGSSDIAVRAYAAPTPRGPAVAGRARTLLSKPDRTYISRRDSGAERGHFAAALGAAHPHTDRHAPRGRAQGVTRWRAQPPGPTAR